MSKMSKKSLQMMMSTKVDEFETINACKHFVRCQFGYGFVAKSTPKFQAPKQTAAMWENEFGTPMPNIVKVTKVTNARSGSYENKVNKVSSSEFQSGEMRGYDWVVPNVIKRAQKDGSLQLCVTFTAADKTTFEPFYVIDNERFATARELQFIKARLYSAPSSKKQIESGVSEEEIVMVRNYKFSNILCVGTTTEINEYWSSLQ